MPKPTQDELLSTVGKLSAELYLSYADTNKKKSKENKLTCLGRDSKTRLVLNRIRMPLLPLLAKNKDLRKSLEPRQKSPLFKVVASAIALKANHLQKQITRASKQEESKEILYRLEPPEDGEWIDKNPLTGEQFNALISP